MSSWYLDATSKEADGLRVVGFDLETTSPDWRVARLLTAAVVVIHPASGEIVEQHSWLAALEEGTTLEPDNVAVHGIGPTRAERYGRPRRAVLAELLQVLKRTTYCRRVESPIVGHNVSYDLNVVAREAVRLDLVDEASWLDAAAVLDSQVLYAEHAWESKHASGRLPAVIQEFGITLSDAHEAVSDATAAAMLALEILRRDEEMKFLSLDDLHAKQIGWHAKQHRKHSDVSTWPFTPPEGWVA